MALLDHQVPEDAKQVTVDLLQQCVGSICVVKFSTVKIVPDAVIPTDIPYTDTVSCGMVTSVAVTGDRSIDESKITLYPSVTDPVEIPGNVIEYIYSLSMLPGAMRLDVPDLMAPPV